MDDMINTTNLTEAEIQEARGVSALLEEIRREQGSTPLENASVVFGD